jgi:hypothetical protein
MFPSFRRLFQRRATIRSSIRPARKQRRPRLQLEELENRLLPSASIITDKLDYSPGQTALITGSGFQSNEFVDLQVLNDSLSPPSAAGLPPTWTVQADATGAFETTWLCTSDLVGASLEADAVGESSGATAVAAFTDGGTQGQGSQLLTYDTTVGIGTLYDTNHKFSSQTVVGVDATGLTGSTMYYIKVTKPGNSSNTALGTVYSFTTAADQTTFNANLNSITGYASDPSSTGVSEFKIFIDTTSDFSSTKSSGLNFGAQTTTGPTTVTVTTSAGGDLTLANASVPLGDTATVSGSDTTGTLSFTLDTPYAGTVTVGSPVHITTGGDYSMSYSLPTDGTTVVGTYTWHVHFASDDATTWTDADDQGVTPTDTRERQIVSPAQPTLVTQAGGDFTLTDATATLTDKATLSGAYLGSSVGGHIIFTLSFNGQAVSGFSVCDPVSGNGDYCASYPLPTDGSTVAGTYVWHAHYCPDGNNLPADDQGVTLTDTREQQVVSPAQPMLVSQAGGDFTLTDATAKLTDTATLSGAYIGSSVGGHIIFTLSFNGQCVQGFSVCDPVNGNGDYCASYPLPTDGSTVAGTYVWHAHYCPDGNNLPADDQGVTLTDTREQQVVSPANPTLTTIATANSPNPGDILLSDSATLSGAYFPNGSTIKFTLHAPNGSTFCETVGVTTGNSAYTTAGTYVANQVGTYYWTAVFCPSNGNNKSATDKGSSAAEMTCITTTGTGGLSLGFWSNKNGNAIETNLGEQFVAVLNASNLSYNGKLFQLTDLKGLTGTAYTKALNADICSLDSFLTGTGKGGNMAYILSVQLAATEMNVLAATSDTKQAASFGDTLSGNTYIDLNAISSTYLAGFNTTADLITVLKKNGANVVGGNLITVNDLISAAVNSLKGNLTTSGSTSIGLYQEALKDVLDAINNGQSIVLAVCPT